MLCLNCERGGAGSREASLELVKFVAFDLGFAMEGRGLHGFLKDKRETGRAYASQYYDSFTRYLGGLTA